MSDIDDMLSDLGIKPTKETKKAVEKAVKNVTPKSDVDTMFEDLGVTPATPGVKRVYVPTRPPSMLDRAPEPVKKAVGYANQFVEGMPIVAPVTDMGAAAIDATAKGFFQPQPNPYGDTWGQRYDSARAKLTGNTKEFAKENPIGSTVANVAGGVAATIPMAMTGPGAVALGLRGPSLGWRVAGGAGGGSLIGGTDAALRDENVLTGAMVGGGGGAAGPLIGEAAHKGTSAALNHFLPKKGALQNIDSLNVNRLAAAVEGETPVSIAARRQEIGPAGFLGDLTPGLTDLTAASAVTPGLGKSVTRQAYEARAGQQLPRIDAALDRAMGPRVDIVQEAQRLKDLRSTNADPLYDQWRQMEVFPTQEIKDLMPRLKAAKAFSMAQELAGIAGDDVTKNFFTTGANKKFPTTASWDYIKQALDRRINAAYSSERGGPLASKLVQLKHDLINEIEKTDAGKVWRDGRNAFREPSELMDQIAAGRDTLLGGRAGLTVNEIKHELQTLSVPELGARIQGVRDAVGEALGASANGDTILRNKLLAPNNQEKIRLLIGDRKVADELIDMLKTEKHLGDKTLLVLGNRATGASNVERGEIKNMLMPNPAREWGFDLQKPGTWAWPALRDQFSIAGMTNARRADKHNKANNQLSHILTMPNDPSMEDLVLALQREGTRQQQNFGRTQTGGNLLTGAISGPGTTTARRQYFPTQ